MAFKFLFLHLVTALVAVNFIFADENSVNNLPSESGDDRSGGLPNLSNLPSFGSGLSSLFGSRQERSADHEESDDVQQERLFFGSIVSCNYTSQGGTTCSSCRQSLACYPNNVGRLRTCRGLLRYCNNGRCSFIPGSQCTSTSSNSTTSNSTA